MVVTTKDIKLNEAEVILSNRELVALFDIIQQLPVDFKYFSIKMNKLDKDISKLVCSYTCKDTL